MMIPIKQQWHRRTFPFVMCQNVKKFKGKELFFKGVYSWSREYELQRCRFCWISSACVVPSLIAVLFTMLNSCNEKTRTRLSQAPQRENRRPIKPTIIQILSTQVRCAPDTGRSSEAHICNCRRAAAENVSSIGTLTSNNTLYERQTTRLNRETARQAEIKSNPAPVIWLCIHRSGLVNLIPGLSHKKPSATQEKWQGEWKESGREVDVEWARRWMQWWAWIIMNQGA